MSFLNSVVQEFRRRRLWPVALLLVAVIIAIPLALSSTPSPPALPPAPPVATAQVPSVPVLNAAAAPSSGPVRTGGRDPFTPLAGARAAGTSASATAVARVAGSIASAVTQQTTRSSAPAGPVTVAHASPSPIPAPSHAAPVVSPVAPPVSRPLHRVPMGNPGSGTGGAPTPGTGAGGPGLRRTQAWVVAASVSAPGGSLSSLDPLIRDSVLPGRQTPGLIELGVLRGGRSVLFAVASDATVTGPGTCTPGPSDCEVVALSIDRSGLPETVSVSLPSGSTLTQSVSVTDIRRQGYPTRAAALRARGRTDSAGAALLTGWTQPALSLFSWDNSLGHLVDQRDLIVGQG